MTLDELVAGFREVATASVADAVDKVAGKVGFLDQAIKPRINEKKICGPAVTILEGPTQEFVPPQHALDAIDEADAGSVIVISVAGSSDVAVWGGLMTAGAVANKHEAAVLNGGVRDIVEIKRDYDFPRLFPHGQPRDNTRAHQDHRGQCGAANRRSDHQSG